MQVDYNKMSTKEMKEPYNQRYHTKSRRQGAAEKTRQRGTRHLDKLHGGTGCRNGKKICRAERRRPPIEVYNVRSRFMPKIR